MTFRAAPEDTMRPVCCALHPGSQVRRYRGRGPNGPGVYPQCIPRDGSQPHLLSWEEARRDSHGLRHSYVAHDAAFAALSPSELDVLSAAAHGMTTTESARHLGKGTETVKTQRRQVILKLGARNIANAVALATSSGNLTSDRAN
jgi:DNA-binding CsgD family transcriptional regulator